MDFRQYITGRIAHLSSFSMVHSASTTLLEKQLAKPDAIVVASRGLRTEGVKFKLFYAGFKRLFAALTGWRLDFGNFSMMPAKHAHSLAMMPELWNHYPSSVIRSGRPLRRVRVDRAAESDDSHGEPLAPYPPTTCTTGQSSVLPLRLLKRSFLGA